MKINRNFNAFVAARSPVRQWSRRVERTADISRQINELSVSSPGVSPTPHSQEDGFCGLIFDL
jgi:hypothetical protein